MARGNNRNMGVILACLNCWVEYNPLRSSENQFCSYKCFQEDRKDKSHKLMILKFKEWNYKPKNPRYLKKALIREYWNICVWCGNTERLWRPIPLEIHHKDWDSTNTIPSNIDLLCPNCHTFTDTYKSKNKNSTRKRKADVV